MAQLLILLAFFGLLLWALVRRFDWVTGIVGAGMVLSLLTVWQMPESQQHYVLAAIDAVVAAALALIVSYHVNKHIRGWNDKAHRAQFITIAACVKVSVWIVYHGGGFGHWNTAAAMSNAILVYQLLVAGGVGHVAICRGVNSLSDAIRKRIRGGKDRGVA